MGTLASSHTTAPGGIRLRVWMTCSMAALAGLLFELDIGVIAGALPFIAKDFHVSDRLQEWIVSSMMVGAAIGALLAGWLSFRLGRKYSLLLGAATFVVGALACAFAPNPAILIAARLVLGLAVGIATFTGPLYLSEIAPGNVRGAMVSTYQLMITVGILAAFFSDTAFSASGSWRWMLGIVSMPAAISLLGVLALPDSPRWLIMKGRDDEARAVLKSLRPETKVVDQEMREIAQQLKVNEQGFALLPKSRDFRRSLMLGIMLQIVQQLTGINVVMYYAPRIFGLAGYSGHQAQLWGTVIVGAVNVLQPSSRSGWSTGGTTPDLADRLYRHGSWHGRARLAAPARDFDAYRATRGRSHAIAVYRRFRHVGRPHDLDPLLGDPADQGKGMPHPRSRTGWRTPSSVQRF